MYLKFFQDIRPFSSSYNYSGEWVITFLGICPEEIIKRDVERDLCKKKN